MKLDSEIINKQKNHFPYNKYTNWETYKETLNEKIICNIPLKTPKHIENSIEQFQIELYKAITAATPRPKYLTYHITFVKKNKKNTKISL